VKGKVGRGREGVMGKGRTGKRKDGKRGWRKGEEERGGKSRMSLRANKNLRLHP